MLWNEERSEIPLPFLGVFILSLWVSYHFAGEKRKKLIPPLLDVYWAEVIEPVTP